MSQVELNEEKLMELTGKVFENVSAAGSLLVAYIGDQAGVYSSLDEHGPCSAEVLAEKTNLDERYLLEWLSANAAMGYITYYEDNGQFALTPEQAAIFAHEGEPTCMQGLFQGIVAQYATHDVALDVFNLCIFDFGFPGNDCTKDEITAEEVGRLRRPTSCAALGC